MILIRIGSHTEHVGPRSFLASLRVNIHVVHDKIIASGEVALIHEFELPTVKTNPQRKQTLDILR